MISPTYGQLNMEQVARHIIDFITSKSSRCEIYIGTDSQNFHYTKTVLVIAVHCIGHGGIFFYDVQHMHKITSIKHKLMMETIKSVELAENLKSEFERLYDETSFDYTEVPVTIHVDASTDGKSGRVINEISNYVHAYGYQFTIKPESYAAYSIANRISK